MDNVLKIILIISPIVSLILMGVALFKLQEIKVHINSRFDEFLKLAKSSGHAAGLLEGKAEQKGLDKGH